MRLRSIDPWHSARETHAGTCSKGLGLYGRLNSNINKYWYFILNMVKRRQTKCTREKSNDLTSTTYRYVNIDVEKYGKPDTFLCPLCKYWMRVSFRLFNWELLFADSLSFSLQSISLSNHRFDLIVIFTIYEMFAYFGWLVLCVPVSVRALNQNKWLVIIAHLMQF